MKNILRVAIKRIISPKPGAISFENRVFSSSGHTTILAKSSTGSGLARVVGIHDAQSGTFYVHDLYVSEQLRRRGLATALLERAALTRSARLLVPEDVTSEVIPFWERLRGREVGRAIVGSALKGPFQMQNTAP